MIMYSGDINYFEIGQRLHAFRVSSAMKVEEIAKMLHISRAAVYRLENGAVIKLDTLKRLAGLLNTSVSSLLGVDIEYYSSGEIFFERMRQLESQSDAIYSLFSPFSFLLTSPDYLAHLAVMLEEAENGEDLHSDYVKKLNIMLAILQARKNNICHTTPKVHTLIGIHNIEQFLHLGLVGSLDLSPSVKMSRVMAARREVEHLITTLEAANDNLQVSIVEGVVPSFTFELFKKQNSAFALASSPFRLGEFPNVTTGVASIAFSPEALMRYEQLFVRLWDRGRKDLAAIELLKKTMMKY